MSLVSIMSSCPLLAMRRRDFLLQLPLPLCARTSFLSTSLSSRLVHSIRLSAPGVCGGQVIVFFSASSKLQRSDAASLCIICFLQTLVSPALKGTLQYDAALGALDPDALDGDTSPARSSNRCTIRVYLTADMFPRAKSLPLPGRLFRQTSRC